MQSKKILFFHNSDKTARLCRKILGKDYEIIDGALDVEGAGQACNIKPDMALIDLEDGMETGLELCRSITTTADTLDIPVMVLFTRDDRKTADRALALGAVDYSSKPLIPALFAKRVQTTIERFADKLPHCRKCRRPMRPEWSFCPFDGDILARDKSS